MERQENKVGSFSISSAWQKGADTMAERLAGIRLYEERRKKIKKMNLTSDLFSSVVFEDVRAVQDVLRILTGLKDLIVTCVIPQRNMRNLFGHSSVLDVWAEDACGKQYNMEIQMAEDEDHLKRSRFIQSRIDSRIFAEGEEYENIPELYLIFITEKDFLNIQTGITEVVRVVEKTGRRAENGVHEIYANLEYPAEDEDVDRLLKYIKSTNDRTICTDGFENLTKRVNFLKENEGGVNHMCEWAEWERAEGMKEGMKRGKCEARDRINLLNIRLAEDGRINEVIQAAGDLVKQKELLEEYGI